VDEKKRIATVLKIDKRSKVLDESREKISEEAKEILEKMGQVYDKTIISYI